MRLLFLGDLAGTGFGTVTQDLGKALLNLDHDVRFVSQNELGDIGEPFKSRTFVVNDPNGWMALKADGIAGLISGSVFTDGWRTETAIVLGDFRAVHDFVLANEGTKAAFEATPTLHYVPIEGHDLPPSWKRLWDVVTPVAMSEFGANEIERVTGVRPPVIYHGVDTEQFRPVTAEHPLRLVTKSDEGVILNEQVLRSKADCKRLFGGSPKGRWILRTDRHMPRKGYPSWIRSVSRVFLGRPDTFAVIHCRSYDQGGDLNDTLSKYPEPIRTHFINTGFHDIMGGASRDILTALYNAADVYASNSSEGFGLTIAEAVACGTPAVGMDYSAVPEVIGPAGLTVPMSRLVDNEYDHVWGFPDEVKFADSIGTLLDDEVMRRRLGRLGPDWVKTNFSWDRAAILFSAAASDLLTLEASA